MLARMAVLTMLACASSQAVHAEPPIPHRCGPPLGDYPPADADVCRLDLAPLQAESASVPPAIALGDIPAGRGPGVHARLLRQIAVYASVGNRDGVEILTARLRALGVSAETVSEAVTWTKLHDAPQESRPAAAPRDRKALPIQTGWEMSR